MAIEPERIVLTYQDYMALPEDGKRYELFEGEIDMAPATNVPHQTIVGNLFLILSVHIRAHGLGKIFVAPCDVVLSDTTVLQPDLLFVSRERELIVTRENVQGAPDLVVEVTSPASALRDRGIKQQLYAKYGVAHYWLVNPARRELVALSLEAGSYHQTAAAKGEEVFSAPPFSDLPIPLTETWE